MVGEPATGELAPSGRVFFRDPRVRVADKTGDWKGERFDGLVPKIVGHPKLGADCGQQSFSQLRCLQHPVGSWKIKLTYDTREDFVRLGVRRDSNIEVPVQHHVTGQVVLKLSPAPQQMRWFYSAGKRVLDETRTTFG